jgi:FtsH-binding integral membrane protein
MKTSLKLFKRVTAVLLSIVVGIFIVPVSYAILGVITKNPTDEYTGAWISALLYFIQIAITATVFFLYKNKNSKIAFLIASACAIMWMNFSVIGVRFVSLDMASKLLYIAYSVSLIMVCSALIVRQAQKIASYPE